MAVGRDSMKHIELFLTAIDLWCRWLGDPGSSPGMTGRKHSTMLSRQRKQGDKDPPPYAMVSATFGTGRSTLSMTTGNRMTA
jgi:hypothetical protein